MTYDILFAYTKKKYLVVGNADKRYDFNDRTSDVVPTAADIDSPSQLSFSFFLSSDQDDDHGR